MQTIINVAKSSLFLPVSYVEIVSRRVLIEFWQMMVLLIYAVASLPCIIPGPQKHVHVGHWPMFQLYFVQEAPSSGPCRMLM
ncbi:hypothetical protein V6N11_020935 [Hibiscus sabdariffa]|uniref:Uncharacterized protein n=1 Tax=Hibiscus sabdariffa TaxID=183260 RepID=A0ABR2QA82_9ROSI